MVVVEAHGPFGAGACVTNCTLQVLHMDRNDYYGGESTSFNLTQVRPPSTNKQATCHAVCFCLCCSGVCMPASSCKQPPLNAFLCIVKLCMTRRFDVHSA